MGSIKEQFLWQAPFKFQGLKTGTSSLMQPLWGRCEGAKVFLAVLFSFLLLLVLFTRFPDSYEGQMYWAEEVSMFCLINGSIEKYISMLQHKVL